LKALRLIAVVSGAAIGVALGRHRSGIKSRAHSPWRRERLGRGERELALRAARLKALRLIVVVIGAAIGVALGRHRSGIKSRAYSCWHRHRLGRGERELALRAAGLKALRLVAVVKGAAIGVALGRHPSGVA
jgi:hypothetical protein